MTRLFIPFLLFCFISTHIQAQVVSEKETLRRIYDHTTIMPMGKTFMKDGVMAKLKPFENPLRTELMQTPEAFDRFKKGNRQIYGAMGLLILGIAMNDASAFSFAEAPDKESKVILLHKFACFLS